MKAWNHIYTLEMKFVGHTSSKFCWTYFSASGISSILYNFLIKVMTHWRKLKVSQFFQLCYISFRLISWRHPKMLTALTSDLTKVHVFKQNKTKQKVKNRLFGQVYPGSNSDKSFPSLFPNLLAVWWWEIFWLT